MPSDRTLEAQLEAFGQTLGHHAGEPIHGDGERATEASVGARHRPPGRRWIYLAAAAATVGLVGVGFWAVVRPAQDQIVPVAPAPTEATGQADPFASTTVPAPNITTIQTTAAPIVPTPTTVPLVATTTAPGPSQLQGCGSPDDAEQAAFDLYRQIVVARTIDDMSVLDGCIDTIPQVFDGTAPNCWARCGSARQEFLFDTFRTGEVFLIDQTVQNSVSAAVSYIGTDGEITDVVESWQLVPTSDGLRVDDFTVQPNFLERTASADVIAEYFGHIDSGDWDAAALMLDDGAQSPEERLDLIRLDPASFAPADIAAALAEWCARGCDTRPPEPDDLTFDGRYGVERNGHRVTADWFEGVYSISGLPIRSAAALAAGFNEAAILADGDVTEDEYLTMFAFLTECATAAGAPSPFEPIEFDDLDQRFDTRYAGENGAAFDPCYAEHGQAIDIAFQTDPARSAQRDANYLAVAACLGGFGYDVRAFAQQAVDDTPAGFPSTSVDEQSMEDMIMSGAPYAALENPDNAVILAVCSKTSLVGQRLAQ